MIPVWLKSDSAAVGRGPGIERVLSYALANAVVLTLAWALLAGWSLSRDREARRAQLETAQAGRVAAATEGLAAELEGLAAVARSLAGSSGVVAFLGDGDRSAVEHDFAAHVRHHTGLTQVRLVGAAGQELVRVNGGLDGPEVVAPSELQEKGHRYYVQESRALIPGEVYLSRLDLNMEWGQVAAPAARVLRVVTRTAEGGPWVVLNADGEGLVQRLAGVSLSNEDEVPEWARGSGQRWNGELRTWATHEALGRRLTLVARAEASGVAPSPGPSVLLSVWVILLGVATVLGALQASRTQAHARLRELGGELMRAHEAERRRVARWLHDELGQQATAVALQIDRGVGAADPARRSEALVRAREGADAILKRLGSLGRELRTPVLDDLGLTEALEELAREQAVAVELELELPDDLPADVALQAYRIVQEALRNAVRHARCGRVRVSISVSGRELSVRVQDDGTGALTPRAAGLGMRGMRERAELLGGGLEVHGTSGEGTVVLARLPLDLP